VERFPHTSAHAAGRLYGRKLVGKPRVRHVAEVLNLEETKGVSPRGKKRITYRIFRKRKRKRKHVLDSRFPTGQTRKTAETVAIILHALDKELRRKKR
jgi:hypothetical protein